MAQGKPVSSPRVSVSSPYKGHCEEKQHIQSACSVAQAPYFTDMSADFIKTATEFRGTRGERRILTHSLSHSDDTIINIFLWTEASCPSPESQPVKNTDLGCRGSRLGQDALNLAESTAAAIRTEISFLSASTWRHEEENDSKWWKLVPVWLWCQNHKKKLRILFSNIFWKKLCRIGLRTKSELLIINCMVSGSLIQQRMEPKGFS